MEKTGSIWVAFMVSGGICIAMLCLLLGGNGTSAIVENTGKGDVFSAFAENSELPETQEESRFDDSLWGRLAQAMEEGLSDFYG